MQWPTCQDYDEAVQCPDLFFDDDELGQGQVELTPLGLPKVASGNFASVYRFDCGNRRYGVKCFLRNVYDQHRRYALLSQYTAVTKVDHMVDFEYQLKGICIEGNWFPIVKMQWVEGVGLDQFLRKNWSNKPQIDRVIGQFIELVEGLHSASMAHGDLQHGNIMVKQDALRLVDYDGMYVPLMEGEEASELGHSNYQHPARTSKDFGPRLDDFSAWIIYYSLLFLKLDPSLWQRFEGGEDCLIMKRSDFLDPQRSRLLAEVSRHPVPEIRSCFEPLLSLLTSKLDDVPKFSGARSISPSQSSPITGAAQPKNSSTQATAVPSSFPTAESYFRALRTPTRALVDDNLNKCLLCATFGQTGTDLEVHAKSVTLNTAAIAGRRSVVFRLALIDGSRHYAVKCFLKHDSDLKARYDEIKKHKMPAAHKYFTQYIYLQKGILIGDDLFPIVKMLWLDGETIDKYVSRKIKLSDVDAIESLRANFRQMMKALHDDGVAHGDLEPKNIIVTGEGELKLVDYDAMYVPSLAHLQSAEVGQEFMQHPGRNLSNFGPYLDNYSAVVIDHILSCLIFCPSERFHSWEALLQHVKNKAGLKRQPTALSVPKLRQKPAATEPILFRPSLESLRPDPAFSKEGRFEGEVTKFSDKLQEMNRYRLDLIPPVWQSAHSTI